MNQILELFKTAIMKFLNVLVVILVLGLGAGLIIINGVFITNIANSLRFTGYLDPSVGIQVILVVLSLVWLPILLLKIASRR